MLKIMKHRAPDGAGTLQSFTASGEFTLGMGRLAIIDLKSKIPLPYEDDDGVEALAFNGELYNYIEIREELKKLGWKFRTSSDIEVVLKSYRQWGKGCLDKFNGMFSLAISDGNYVFLARDIAGEKPLYYSLKPFRFASEAKALDFDCAEFPPAHYMIYSLFGNKVTEFKQYWHLKKIKINEKTAFRDLEKLLADAIKIRTRSDVPYALYYSGGVDSALINTFHKFKYKFTYKDGNYAKEFRRKMPKILWHLDYPVRSFSSFGLYKLAELAKRKVKVVISGEGADELFGGYVRYVAPHFNYLAQKKFPSYKSMFGDAMNVSDLGWREFNGNMQELLRMGDRLSSAWGIESRMPFLDKRIIQFAYSLPDHLKINGLETKVILRRILEKRNPKYKDMEKKGLYCSVNKWLGQEGGYDKHEYIKYQNKIWKKLVS